MAKVELVMPKMGESIMEATIISWSKEIGEAVEADETVLEIATDKVDSEVPSPVDGKLVETLFNDGDVVPVGEVIAYIEAEGEETADSPAASPAEPASQPAGNPQPALSTGNNGSQDNGSQQREQVQQAMPAMSAQLTGALLDQPQPGRFYSPLVMSIARTEGIPMEELERLPGTGKEGRVTKKDILQWVDKRKTAGAPEAAPAQSSPQPQPVQQQPAPGVQPAMPVPEQQPVEETATGIKFTPKPHGNIQGIPAKTYSYSGRYEIQEMDRMRKMIADNMVYSKHVSPHVSSFVEADITNLVEWRNRNKKAFQEKYGEKITFTPLFVEALAKTLHDFPLVNVSVNGSELIVKQDINISIAVALPSGNLIAPSIRHADQYNLAGLARMTNDLVARARENKLTPEDIADGTYTLSNVGTFGNVMGTPIILQPQVAIMAVGAIRKKPGVIETPQGDLIAVRHYIMLSHSYDHRVVDGMLGGQFVRKFADYLEAFDPQREV